jgi:3-hydroxyisobutyrate dehydrogenase-like beta-hydroxyacid dehydrogenase
MDFRTAYLEGAMMTTSRRIGWIGIGKMGLPICERLQNAGFHVKALCRNAESESSATSKGLEVARTIAETASDVQIVASAISDDKALLDVAFATGGLKDSLVSGQIFIDTSTVSPEASARVAAALSDIGATYYRSPVSGSTVTASQGMLTAMVSGPSAGFDALADFFAAFTKKAFLVGSAEEARYLKLAINSMVGATAALIAESIALGRKGGLDIETIMAVFVESAVSSPLLQYKRATITSGDFKPAFSAAQMLKDFDLIAGVADSTGCPTPLLSQVRGQYQAALRNRLGDRDFFVLIAEAARAAGLST